MSQLKKRSVAVSFIFQFPKDDTTNTRPKVALFKRSDKVRTYQHKYAPVSGSIESFDANPLATAWREIQEETTLTPCSLTLFRQGKPYSFVDESIQREWTINPFGFILTSDPSKITIDWEHDDYAWFDPADVADDQKVDGVPKLLESLRRVWLEFDFGAAAPVLDAGLTRLKGDHESGARQLAGIALGVFADVLKKSDISDKEVWWANARRAGWHLWKNGRESMGAPILSVVLAGLDVVREKTSEGLSADVVDDIVASLDELARQREASASRIADAFAAFLQQHHPADGPVRILTLSSSSTITRCLTHALASVGHRLDLRILESRPLCEGAKLAYRLSSFAAEHNFSSRVDITVMTDAAAGIASQDVDLLLLGADLIDRHGNVSNKTGSLPAVLAARHVSNNVKVVVVSEKEKVLPFEAPGHEDNDAGEVTRGWDSVGVVRGQKPGGDVKVRNVYFEWVNNGLVDVYVTDEGISGTEDVMRWAADIERRAKDVFDGL
ncbi:translation initiation factor eIF-2B subunit family protein [Metarhizium guizhouense ARSEF 977]|uniref:Translation initiation factor eIF-2B subunit family protein n=1 Tax=Metarhizium guizhouense (strain ARSEF 977) TaxID=1276136 RepID=A0A0B4H087_METGA|nr:translation initiation factor eIF-2B subunit family protein [Metarhizium guizhouense ARSEF 977]